MEITFEETNEFNPIVIPNNFYKAKIVDEKVVTGKGQYGDFVAISFEILEGPHKGKIIDGTANYKLNKRTKLYKWMKKMGINMDKLEIGKKTNISLVGKKCRILTETKERENVDGSKQKYSRVKDVEKRS